MTLLEEYISKLIPFYGSRHAISIKRIGRVGAKITLYDALDIISQLEAGSEEPKVKILGIAYVDDDRNISGFEGDPKVAEIAEKYIKMDSSGLNELIKSDNLARVYIKRNKGIIPSEIR